MKTRSRWADAVFVLLTVGLLALCLAGTGRRYAAVSLANVLALGMLTVQLVRGHHASRAGWAIMAFGTAVLLIHNIGNQVAIAATGSPATGAFACVTLAGGFIFLLAGGVVSTTTFAREDVGGVLDAAVVGLAAASLIWSLVMHPAHVRNGSAATTMAYEMFLLLLVTALTGTVIRAAIVAKEARSAAICLVLAMAAIDLSDAGFTLTLNTATGLSQWWASALCVVAFLAFIAALTHPSALAIRALEHTDRRLSAAHLTFLGLALAVNPALAALQQFLGRPVDVLLLSVGSLLVLPLVVTRIGMLSARHADSERRYHDLALRDELTGLPNRRAMTMHLGALLDRVAAGSAAGAVVLYLDLDGFKSVNDTLGHMMGDRLLRTVGARIRGCVPPDDLVARFGGDEFVVVLEGSGGERVLAAVRAALRAPVPLGTVLASGRASIGVAAVERGDRVDVETLLSRADAEMYRAKRASQDAEPAPALVPRPFPAPGSDVRVQD